MQKLLLVYYHSENRATSQIWKVLPNMVFPPIWGKKNGGVLSMRMQVILDSSFACPGSAPIWGGKKGEFRDWTTMGLTVSRKTAKNVAVRRKNERILTVSRKKNVNRNKI